MKNKALKILFPFYASARHVFLIQKWWFRLIIVAYSIFLVCLPFFFLHMAYDSYVGWCYEAVGYTDYSLFQERLDLCAELHRKVMPDIWLTGIGGWLIVHYLIQFVFFKIVINFIVLGGKKRQ